MSTKSDPTIQLDQAFSPAAFRNLGYELIDLLANSLEEVQNNPEAFVIPYQSPEQELAFWQSHLEEESDPTSLFKTIIDHSIKVHHPRYIGHQVAVPALVGSLAGLISDVMSNGTGVYEMGMSSNALEKVVVDIMCQHLGYEKDAGGFLTSGGTLANLTAMLAARKAKAPNPVWEEGHQERLAIMVSEEAHYCIDRAARIMGLGSEGIIKVPIDEQFKIRTDLLEEYYQEAKQKGLHVIAIIGCASSTATGSYDDLDALADFAAKYNLWYHVDGAHGGGVVFSDTHRHLAKGIHRADSIVIDFHKMLLTPALNTALLFKNSQDTYKTFQQRAQYLWDAQQTEEWYHSGKRTFECTKFMMSIKVYAIIKAHGIGIFGENIDRLFGLGKAFAKMIQAHPDFELAIEPEANIVNFRYTNSDQDLNQLNAHIRQSLVESGKFYIVQTVIQDVRYLRVAIMNPLTKEEDLAALLEEVQVQGSSINSKVVL